VEQPASLAIESLSVRALRNLEHVDLTPSPRFNVVAGDNGQGKTNLLEAIYVAATSKSFRPGKPGELVAHGGEVASVRISVRESSGEPDGDVEIARREQSVGVRAGQRLAKIDGKRPPTLAAYAVATPVVVFHPGEVALSMGASGERRRLLDRIALYMNPSSLAELDAYTRALRERQRALEVRGVLASDLPEWEELIARHGLAVSAARRRAADELALAAVACFARIAAPGLVLAAAYASNTPPDEGSYREALASWRPKDARRNSATVGPHRDDLALAIDGHRVRGVASQGQHRAVVLALKAAEIEVIARARGVRPVLLLDDVSSELDRSRTAALFRFLSEQRGQVFLTTTRPELIETGGLGSPADRLDFRVESGRIFASA
jgi:DNA replication and repair protein RecF